MLVTFGPLEFHFSRKPYELDQICLHIAVLNKIPKIRFEITIITIMRWSPHNVDIARVTSKSVANQKIIASRKSMENNCIQNRLKKKIKLSI